MIFKVFTFTSCKSSEITILETRNHSKKSLVNSLAWSRNSGLPWRKGRDTFSNDKKFEWHNISPGRIPKISFKRSTAKTWLTHACCRKTSLQTHDEYQVHVFVIMLVSVTISSFPLKTKKQRALHLEELCLLLLDCYIQDIMKCQVPAFSLLHFPHL